MLCHIDPNFSLDLKEKHELKTKAAKRRQKNEWSWSKSKSKDNVYLSFAGCMCSLRVTELNGNLKCLSDFGIYLNSLCDITIFRVLEKKTGALEEFLLVGSWNFWEEFISFIFCFKFWYCFSWRRMRVILQFNLSCFEILFCKENKGICYCFGYSYLYQRLAQKINQSLEKSPFWNRRMKHITAYSWPIWVINVLLHIV